MIELFHRSEPGIDVIMAAIQNVAVFKGPEEVTESVLKTTTSVGNVKSQSSQRYCRSADWWTIELAELRQDRIRARRQIARARRRRGTEETEIAELWWAYKSARAILKRAIRRAKADHRVELSLPPCSNPWDRVIHFIQRTWRDSKPPPIDTRLPVIEEGPPDFSSTDPPIMPAEVGVISEEMNRAVQKLCTKTALLRLVGGLDVLDDRLKQLLDNCLRFGRIPEHWKKARVVLFRENERPIESPSVYRPFYLLDEADRIFGRVLTTRLGEHLACVDPDRDRQGSFQQRRAMIEAILRVRSEANDHQGEVATM